MRCLIAAAVSLLLIGALVPAPVLASWKGYAYNYGINWNQAPFHVSNGNLVSVSNAARDHQSLKGYAAVSYSTGWASQIHNNLPNLRLFYFASHGEPGLEASYSPDTRSWQCPSSGQLLTSNVSVLTSNWNPSPLPYYIQVANVRQPINHYRRLDAVSSPVKIAVFDGCQTALLPPGSGNSLTTTST